MTRRLTEMRLAQLQAAVRGGKPLLIAAGCVEAHGSHLPLGTDTIIAEAVVAPVAENVDGVIGPTVDYGPTGYAVSGPEEGTIEMPAEAFYPYAKATIAGLLALGFADLFVVVHHQDLDGAEAAAFMLAQAAIFNELHRDRGAGWWGRNERQRWPRVTVLPTIPADIRDRVTGDHAGRTETSLMLHIRPATVDLSELRPGDYWYSWQPGRESQDSTSAEGERVLSLMVSSVTNAVRAASPSDST